MTQREEACDTFLPGSTIILVEQPSAELPRASIVPKTSADRAPDNPGVAAASDSPALPTVLLKLLSFAQEALAGDRVQADKFIAQATALVSAEVKGQQASGRSPHGAPAHSHLAPWQRRRVVEFVETNLAYTIRIGNLAQVARLSVSHFSKAFRSDFGEPPYAYIVRRRIERAQEMMVLTEESLAGIAVACGLADQAHLTRLFRRIVGASPASWRRLRCLTLQ
jgi:AraC-like DNA-binding protein